MTMRMLAVQQMVFILLVFMCRPGSTSTAAPRMAKDGCTEHCGNVIIPYPFGIGPAADCYFDEWFQIDCNKSSNSTGVDRPFLRRAELEVLHIDTNGTLQVNSPVTVFCKGNESRQPADLRESPFVYSQSSNVFTSVSCNYLALVSSADNIVAGGCRSVCDRGNTKMRCDTGINCCQTSIPPYVNVINATLYEETSDCSKFGFLVDKDWFQGYISDPYLGYSEYSEYSEYSKYLNHPGYSVNTTDRLNAIKSKGTVPVNLYWSLINDTKSFDIFQKFAVDDNFTGYGRVSDNLTIWFSPYCYINNALARVNGSAGDGSVIDCNCRGGMEGNPYLGECHDINECINNRCGHNYRCVNEVGWYLCRDKSKVKLVFITGLSSSLGLLFLLIGAWFGYRFLKKRNDIKQKQRLFKRNGGLLLEQQLSSGEVNVEKIKLFKSEELEKSTDNFNLDRILGQGGQGTVYKGMLEDGRIIAVKKSKMVDESQVSQFINEVVILSQINHRNVVQLLGCCLETEVPLLVYEYIPNGTLSQYIADQIEEFPLTWQMRLRIAIEVAGALSHLHYTASFPIYHRDIKSSNILLDEKYRAKIADFGTSRSIAIDQTHLTTSLVHGTFGYLDPEYFQSSQFTEKSDVYSFGVVLVELLTGQKPISFQRLEEDGRSLATYFIISMQKDRLFEIVDARVLKEGLKSDIGAMANLARRCLHLNGRVRPTMREVTAELEGIQMSKKNSSNGEQHYEEVEFLRTELVDPWDAASSSTGTGSGLDAAGSSFHEIPLLSFKSR